VRYALEGSVRKAGNRVRITVQLIDAETDRHIWAERYDRTLDDLFDVQADPRDFRYRLIGTRVREHLSEDRRGQWLSAIAMTRPPSAAWTAKVALVSGRGARSHSTTPCRSGSRTSGSRRIPQSSRMSSPSSAGR